MTTQRTRRALLTGTAAALTGLAGCSSVPVLGSGSDSPADAPGASAMHATDAKTGYGIELAANPVMGPDDAPVDVYYWSDFQCPFCKRFEQNTLPKLVDEYVTPGRIRFVFLELPNIGDASWPAARASKCVWRQAAGSNPGAYLDWHAAVFDAQEQPNSGWASKEDLFEITRNVDGVDAASVRSCLENRREWANSAIDADVGAARKSGVSATPGFVLYNPESDKAGKIVGAQPFERFETAIERVENA